LKVATVFRFGLVTAFVIAATSIGYADVKHVFAKGDVVSAAAMNENFADMDGRITSAHVATNGTSSYSMGATKACTSAPMTDGNIGKGVSGYALAKKACEASCGSKTAHMCSAEEVVRLAQMGTPANPGWISTGLAATTPGPTAVVNDCAASQDVTVEYLDGQPAPCRRIAPGGPSGAPARPRSRQRRLPCWRPFARRQPGGRGP